MQDPRSAEIAERFSRQAAAYAGSESHAYGADLDIVAAYAEPGQYYLCLDIGCGPGHTALRIASKASVVVGVDISQGMLDAARKLAAEREITNVVFQQAEATALPFQDASFDLVTCRTAAHHFTDIPAFLAEAYRVLRPDGRLVLDDMLAPDDSAAAALLHDLDRQRDPGHVRSLTAAKWRELLASAGLTITRETLFEELQPYGPWLDRMAVPEEMRGAMLERLLGAPCAQRDSIAVMAGDLPSQLKLSKLIVRAEKH